jgi:Rrf2 family protein
VKLTKKSDYALRLLISLAENHQDKILPTRWVAEQENIPLKFLQSVVSSLVREGILESIPGPKGGNKLLKSPDQISVLDVIEAVEGTMNLMDCMAESSQCGEFRNCKIHSLFGKAQFAMNEVLAECTLSQLVDCPLIPGSQK